MRIYLIRHTAVGVPPGTCYGQSDVPLAQSWREDFARVREKLPQEALQADKVYASPLCRCRRLAHSLYDDVHFDERLKEISFGAWEGLLWRDLPSDQIEAWRLDYQNFTAHGGESYGQLQNRSGAVLDEIIAQPLETALVVAHGGVILALLARLLGLSAKQVFRLQVDYGSVSALLISDDWFKVEYINR